MKDEMHLFFMRHAMNLAARARGMTSPNPLVGALVVKGGRVIAAGFHQKAGEPHAEVIALDKAGKEAKGSVLYVTLEPCTHFGKTPPCVDRIIASGIKEVVVGMVDPNPLNNGKGLNILRSRGIKVTSGVLEEELKKINAPFIKYITRGLPYVTVKTAQSLDGKIACAGGDSKWISSDRSRALAHRLRARYDAVMVGVNTVLRDNPKLDAWFSKKQPAKVIIDSRLSVHPEAHIFSSGGGQAIIVTLSSAPGQETSNRAALSAKAMILQVKEKSGQINLKDALKRLARMGIINILVEGGGTLNGSLFDEGLVDKVMFFISPKIIGGKEAASPVMGKGISHMDKVIKLKEVSLKRIGEDFLVEGYIK